MTLPSLVLTALRFWKSTAPNQVIWNTTGVVTNDLPSDVSSGNVTAITNALDDIYTKSPTYFQPVIDTFITNGAGVAHSDDPIKLFADWIDDAGAAYAPAENTLWIFLPTNEAIYVNGWSNGDMGIYLPGY
jgi:hypothetical protein